MQLHIYTTRFAGLSAIADRAQVSALLAKVVGEVYLLLEVVGVDSGLHTGEGLVHVALHQMNREAKT